jgi:hypothetical protein
VAAGQRDKPRSMPVLKITDQMVVAINIMDNTDAQASAALLRPTLFVVCWSSKSRLCGMIIASVGD